jgi:hypothetical protein
MSTLVYIILLVKTQTLYVRFKVLMAANMNMSVFWAVAPCSLVGVYRRFRGACYLRLQGNNPEDSHLHELCIFYMLYFLLHIDDKIYTVVLVGMNYLFT